MEALWTEELTDQEKNDLIERLANEVLKRKLETPAVIFLEMNRPLSRITANAMIVFSPFLAPIVGTQNVHNYSRLLMDPANVETLIQRIESGATAKLGGTEATH